MKIRNLSAPKWLIFLIDVIISTGATLVAYFLRFNFKIPDFEIDSFRIVFPLVIFVRSVTFFASGIYQAILRFTGTSDVIRITLTVFAGSAIFCLMNCFSYFIRPGHIFIIPFSIIIIDFLATTFLMISYRFFIKLAHMDLQGRKGEYMNIIIFGAGESGIISKRTMDRDAANVYKIIAFIDDDEKKDGRKLEGIPIRHSDQLDELLNENKVDHLIISVQNLQPKRLNDITEICLRHNTKVLNVPPVSKWINGELSFKQIRGIRIEDLLGREPILLDVDMIRAKLEGKIILVTGAAGSIGSGLVRQILNFNPKKVILFDQAETPLYDLENHLIENRLIRKAEVVVGDIRNEKRMRRLFDYFKPEIVFHAAAYKHVPLMELNPSEAVLTNILGTKILADLSNEFGVKTFVMISTDKAVNPTNVMGSSKRIAEMYTQALNSRSKTEYITTRFGNVLGSNGSVIPLFKRQIESGGPVTVTDPKVTRYFMTISEACQLVLEAGALGRGGEIFIFDMGKSVKIVDLAKKMIKLSGLELGKDIQIVFTGLRPGEKLFEELLNDAENAIPTHHSQIMKAKVAEVEYAYISSKIDELIALFDLQDNSKIVSLMKVLVPEFKSMNSEFQKLDV